MCGFYYICTGVFVSVCGVVDVIFYWPLWGNELPQSSGSTAGQLQIFFQLSKRSTREETSCHKMWWQIGLTPLIRNGEGFFLNVSYFWKSPCAALTFYLPCWHRGFTRVSRSTTFGLDWNIWKYLRYLNNSNCHYILNRDSWCPEDESQTFCRSPDFFL